MDHHEWAQSLRRRLNDHAVDIELLTAEALNLFEAVQSPVHVRWLQLELRGYGITPGHSPLVEVLGVAEGDRLAVHISAYRVREGRIIDPNDCDTRVFRHFFVESLREVGEAADRVRRGIPGAVQLDFGPNISGYPIAVLFSDDIFDRILLGFRAVLHLQLGGVGP